METMVTLTESEFVNLLEFIFNCDLPDEFIVMLAKDTVRKYTLKTLRKGDAVNVLHCIEVARLLLHSNIIR